MKKRWDIFCAVVDNYGDIGVCWRLARQLVREHALAVRLWVDEPEALAKLCPEFDPCLKSQCVDGVEIRHWVQSFGQADCADVADVVIEAFACDLPLGYLDSMTRKSTRPVWVNLEYLSAEPWVEGCHRRISPHPRLPLTKHFFFPGFTSGAGGVLREADYDIRRADFGATGFRYRLGLPEPVANEITISLFGYENAGIAELVDAWSSGRTPVRCLVPQGRLLPEVAACFGASDAAVGDRWQRGKLDVHVLPFLPQPDYDALLWLCNLNFVRGEDSFVRAQLAGQPFVWQIYPQEHNHHLIKLQAFLDLLFAGVDTVLAEPVRRFWLAWEAGCGLGAAWPAFSDALPAFATHTGAWTRHLCLQPDLATQLVSFVTESG